MGANVTDHFNEDIIQGIVGKLREINELAIQLPLEMQHDVYDGAKRHFYIAMCQTNRLLKEKER